MFLEEEAPELNATKWRSPVEERGQCGPQLCLSWGAAPVDRGKSGSTSRSRIRGYLGSERKTVL
jgi:hypothetical protein